MLAALLAHFRRWGFSIKALSMLVCSDAAFVAFAEDAEPQATQSAVDEKTDRFSVPSGGAQELIAFLKRLPADGVDTEEEYYQRLKVSRIAGEKLLATDDENKKLDGYDKAIGIYFLYRAEVVRQNGEERAAFIRDITSYLGSTDIPAAETTWSAAWILSLIQESDPKMAAEFFRDVVAALGKRGQRQAIETMEGIRRATSLVGQSLEIRGTTTEGKKFDLTELRGKVVLVEFWTHGCGACIRELPNIKANYDRYHDRGFEVVGISLDVNRQVLDRFLEKERLPWTVLYDGSYDKNPNAIWCGVVAVPVLILVNAEGIIVSTNARGDELGKHLKTLIGEVHVEEIRCTR